ncbi:MAG: hypothetical protein ACD_37C00658G0001, partial [uncultured bacterium]
IIISLIIGGSGGIYFVKKSIQKNKNSGMQIIGGQTVINNYGIGDPLLERQQRVENPVKEESLDSAIEKARSALGLTGTNVKFLSDNLQEVYKKAGLSKTASTMINGAIFALSSWYTKENPEWREHCSGSLRGLVDKWRDAGAISTAFCGTFNNKDSNCPNLKTHANQYKQLIDSFNYFSDIHHHDAVNILVKIRVLKGQNTKTGSDTNELFVEIAKEYLEILINLLTEATKQNEST